MLFAVGRQSKIKYKMASSAKDVQMFRSANDVQPNSVIPGMNQKDSSDILLDIPNDFEILEDDVIANEENAVYKLQNAIQTFCTSNKKFFKRGFTLLFLVAFTVYFGFAVDFSVQKSMALIVITAIVVALIIYVFIRDYFGAAIYPYWE